MSIEMKNLIQCMTELLRRKVWWFLFLFLPWVSQFLSWLIGEVFKEVNK